MSHTSGILRAACALLCTSLLAACASGPVVRSDYDPATNFAVYKTFAYFSPLGTDKQGYQSLTTTILKAATRTELEARGYKYDEAHPDLLVNFAGRLDDKITTTPGGPPDYYGYRNGLYSPYSGWNDTYVDTYTQGTLNVDLIDARQKKLVWEGIAVARVTNAMRDDPAPLLTDAVREIFAKYPFVAGHN